MNGRGRNNVTLSWAVSLYDHEAEPILKNGNVSKEAYVSLVDSDREEQLWPTFKVEKDTQMSISVDEKIKALKIALIELKAGGTSNGEEEILTPATTDEFTCKDEDGLVGISSKKTIYQSLIRRDPLSTDRKKESIPLKMSVSLSGCEFGKGGKQAECSLKVVIKVTQKTQ